MSMSRQDARRLARSMRPARDPDALTHPDRLLVSMSGADYATAARVNRLSIVDKYRAMARLEGVADPEERTRIIEEIERGVAIDAVPIVEEDGKAWASPDVIESVIEPAAKIEEAQEIAADTTAADHLHRHYGVGLGTGLYQRGGIFKRGW